ncbi:MAG: hypothetical protein VKK59_07810 [Vampirovibrionales bacterium]|nr:hypothetical protein [Vampirovibrionales bacterium]
MRQVLSLIFAGLGVGLLIGQWLPGPLASYMPWRVRVKAMCEGTCADIPQTIRLGRSTVVVTTQETPSAKILQDDQAPNSKRSIVLTAIGINQSESQRLLPTMTRWVRGWNRTHAHKMLSTQFSGDLTHVTAEFHKPAVRINASGERSQGDSLQAVVTLPTQVYVASINPALKALQAEQQTLQNLLSRYTAAHPLVIQSQERIKVLQTSYQASDASKASSPRALPMASQGWIKLPISLSMTLWTQRLNNMEQRLSRMDLSHQRLMHALDTVQQSAHPAGKLIILSHARTPLPSEHASRLGLTPGVLSLALAMALNWRPKRQKNQSQSMLPTASIRADERATVSANDFVFSLKPRRHLIPADTAIHLSDWLRVKARQSSGRSLLLLGLSLDDDALQPYSVGLLSRQIGLKWASRGLSTLLIDGPGVNVDDHSVRAPLSGFKSEDSGWQWWQYANWNLLHGVSSQQDHVQPWPTPPWPSAYAYTLLSASQEGMSVELSPQKTGFNRVSSLGWPCEDVVLVATRRDKTRWHTPIEPRHFSQWQRWAQAEGLYLQGVIDVRLG